MCLGIQKHAPVYLCAREYVLSVCAPVCGLVCKRLSDCLQEGTWVSLLCVCTSIHERARERQCCARVVGCRRVNLEGVGLRSESVYVSVLGSGDWSMCRADAHMWLSSWHKADPTSWPSEIGVHVVRPPGTLGSIQGVQGHKCVHMLGREATEGGGAHIVLVCPWKSGCRDLGPCGFWHVHTCWCDNGVMARMGTADSSPPPVPLSSKKLGDWAVSSGRRRLGAWNPGSGKAAGRPDS